MEQIVSFGTFNSLIFDRKKREGVVYSGSSFSHIEFTVGEISAKLKYLFIFLVNNLNQS